MQDQDILERWLFMSEFNLPAEQASEYRAYIQETLDELDEYLSETPKKIDYGKLRLEAFRWQLAIPLLTQNVTRAQSLYRHVYQLGGSRVNYAQRGLLSLIALSQDPESVPFWQEILTFVKPRDNFRQSRINWALSALALLAIQKNLPTAHQGLLSVAKTHADKEARGLALHFLGEVYAATEKPLPEELKSEILQILKSDPAFEPRFQSRALMRKYSISIPMDNPDGAYAFKVKFTWNKHINCTIELRSEQTLEDLHFAIQQAINWDADHLYSFYMNGELYDDRYGFACPFEKDRPPWTNEAVLGELGLVLGHKFLYYFDYGDSHKFEVEVVEIHPRADDGKYPRLVESHGEMPPQYGW
jgi:hypothetical protein